MRAAGNSANSRKSSGIALYLIIAPGKGMVRPMNKNSDRLNSIAPIIHGSDATIFNWIKKRIAKIHRRKMVVSSAVINWSMPRASHMNGRTRVLTIAAGAALK